MKDFKKMNIIELSEVHWIGLASAEFEEYFECVKEILKKPIPSNPKTFEELDIDFAYKCLSSNIDLMEKNEPLPSL